SSGSEWRRMGSAKAYARKPTEIKWALARLAASERAVEASPARNPGSEQRRMGTLQTKAKKTRPSGSSCSACQSRAPAASGAPTNPVAGSSGMTGMIGNAMLMNGIVVARADVVAKMLSEAVDIAAAVAADCAANVTLNMYGVNVLSAARLLNMRA